MIFSAILIEKAIMIAFRLLLHSKGRSLFLELDRTM